MMNNPAYGGSQIDKEIKYVDLMLSNICDEGGANYEKAWCHNRICVRGTNRNGAFYCDKVELTDTECAWSQFRGIEVGGGGVTVTCGPLGEQEIFAPRGGKDAEELGQAMYRILRLKQKQ
jgi:hypothetical protein